MKILSPVSVVDEVDMLVDSGAGELYCGLQPQDWTSTYSGALWMNRRSPAGARACRSACPTPSSPDQTRSSASRGASVLRVANSRVLLVRVRVRGRGLDPARGLV